MKSERDIKERIETARAVERDLKLTNDEREYYKGFVDALKWVQGAPELKDQQRQAASDLETVALHGTTRPVKARGM